MKMIRFPLPIEVKLHYCYSVLQSKIGQRLEVVFSQMFYVPVVNILWEIFLDLWTILSAFALLLYFSFSLQKHIILKI